MKVMKVYIDDLAKTVDRIQFASEFVRLDPLTKMRVIQDVVARLKERAKRIVKEEKHKLEAASARE